MSLSLFLSLTLGLLIMLITFLPLLDLPFPTLAIPLLDLPFPTLAIPPFTWDFRFVFLAPLFMFFPLSPFIISLLLFPCSLPFSHVFPLLCAECTFQSPSFLSLSFHL